MAFGLDSTGFTLKRLTDILTDLKTAAQSSFGPDVTTDDDSVFGQLFSIVSEQLAFLWEGLQAVYDSQKPDAAEGVSLDDVADLNGVVRLAATSSIVNGVLSGDPATVIPIASLASVDPTNDQFSLDAAITLSTTSVVGFDATSGSADGTYTITINATPFSHVAVSETAIVIVAALKVLVDAGSEPVTFTDNLDGTFRIAATDQALEFTLAVTANITINKVSRASAWSSVDTGPVEAPTGTLTQIDTPVFGWDSITNSAAATLGADQETDTELRIRRRESVSLPGAGTVDSIISNLRQVAGVTDAFVVENRTFVVDGDGRPPKSFEAVVTGGLDQTIGQTVWDRKPVGIESVGDIDISATDINGATRTVSFSRPTSIWVHLEIDYIRFAEELFPINGEVAIAEAADTFGKTLGISEDVILQRFLGPIFDDVAGIQSLVIRQATSPTEFGAPGTFVLTDLAIGPTEIARFDPSRITVLDVTP